MKGNGNIEEYSNIHPIIRTHPETGKKILYVNSMYTKKILDMDGKESSSFYMRQQANDYSYQGQQGPQPIFDPLAWSKFFKQWKKKEMTAKEEQMIKILEITLHMTKKTV